MSTIYVNAGKFKSVVGLLLLTLGTAYVSHNSTRIVEGSISLAKKGWKMATGTYRRRAQRPFEIRQDIDGNYYLIKKN